MRLLTAVTQIGRRTMPPSINHAGQIPAFTISFDLAPGRALSDAAMELAFEVGLDNVTREDIANRAGVSLRTFTNYFAGKHEAIAYRQLDRIRRSIAL